MEWCFIVQSVQTKRIYFVEAESPQILRHKLKQEGIIDYEILDSGYRKEVSPIYVI